jgi:ribosomal 30S subunit maturation factor RimM
VELGTGTPLLVVTAGKRGEVLVPLADTICRRIDVAGKRIEIDPPDGLIELNNGRS